MNVRINLLPHREMRRERRKKDFIAVVAAVALGAAAVAFAVGMVINQQIEAQRSRNAFIAAENAKLDEQIKEIASLRAEIEALRARQEAVETLQSNRTIPVHLVDELVSRMPEGAFLKSLRQDERKITLVGLAQSNERISDLLRALANDSPWLERPELVEIKAVALASPQQQQAKAAAREQAEPRRVYEFSINALIRTANAEPRPAPGAKPGAKPGAGGKVAQAGASTTTARN